MRKGGRVCVLASGNEIAPRYTEPAREFTRLLVKNGYSLVWGGSNVGLMKIVASEARKAGGKIAGVTMELVKDVKRRDADEMVIARDLPERKKIMLEKSDAIVAMVGGIGTLDEVTEMMELKKHNAHRKPIVFLNTDNFYEGVKNQLQRMKDEGFITKELNELACFADTPREAIESINKGLGR